jgi:hypothetical protein
MDPPLDHYHLTEFLRSNHGYSLEMWGCQIDHRKTGAVTGYEWQVVEGPLGLDCHASVVGHGATTTSEKGGWHES